MFLCKIIKGADIRDNLLQALPLRHFEPGGKSAGDSGADDSGASLRDWAAAQAEEIISRARTTADEIIQQAQVEAEEIKEDAEEIKEVARRSAFEQGHKEGVDQGYREGLARAEEEAAAIRAQAAEVLAQAEEIRRRTLEALEGEVVDLAREIAERLLSSQLILDPEIVLNVARESLSLVTDRINVILYINPNELKLVENRQAELRSLLPARAEFQVIADSSIRPGGCRIETEQGEINATLEARREALLKALYDGK